MPNVAILEARGRGSTTAYRETGAGHLVLPGPRFDAGADASLARERDLP